ncbi:GSCOCG00011103001-RA-CDS [Cotesia congregata]|nr:GSCOCG00011103001-RA-CDS [Cotesia congregata]
MSMSSSGLASNQDEESNIQLETKLKDLLDIDEEDDNSDDYVYEDKLYNNAFDQEFAEAALDYIENSETEKSNVIEETKPFQHFNPVEKNSTGKKAKKSDKRAQVVNQSDSKLIDKDGNRKRENVVFKRIKDTFYNHKLIISLPVGASILGGTCLFSCICTLILRRKIANCCACCVSRCCRKKKKDSCEDLERGKTSKVKPKRAKRSRAAKPVRAATPVIPATPVTSVASQPSWPRAKSLSEDYVDAAVQHVTVVEPLIPPRETIVETPPTGCGCCKKKRPKNKYR